MENCFYIHPTSSLDDNVNIGENTKIWHYSHIQSGAVIGSYCSLGQNVNISNNVIIGNYVKIQNNVSVYEGVTLEDYVFCGPSCVFTNDLTPRSRYPKNHRYVETVVHHDATICANATIICGNSIGHHATIAAGAVVTTDVPPHALMVGVPARQVGYVCECGQVLSNSDLRKRGKIRKKLFLSCPDCKKKYVTNNNELKLVSENRE